MENFVLFLLLISPVFTQNNIQIYSFRGAVYYIDATLKSLTAAQESCEDFGLEIVKVNNADELNFLQAKTLNGKGNGSFWTIDSKIDEPCVDDGNGSTAEVPCERMTICQLRFSDASWRDELGNLRKNISHLERVSNSGSTTTVQQTQKENRGFLSNPAVQIGTLSGTLALILLLFILVILSIRRSKSAKELVRKSNARQVSANGGLEGPEYMSVFYNNQPSTEEIDKRVEITNSMPRNWSVKGRDEASCGVDDQCGVPLREKNGIASNVYDTVGN